MPKQVIFNCAKCGIEKRRGKLIKIKEKLYCARCKNGQSKTLMPKLFGKIPKSYLPPKLKKKKKKIVKKIKQIIEPKIRGARDKKKGGLKRGRGAKAIHLYLTKEERLVLYKKFIKQGLSEQVASERVNNICKRMSELVKELRKKIKDKKELNKRFKEEFARICEDLK